MSEEINNTSIKDKLTRIADGITTNMYEQFSLVDWRPILAKECQVYVYNEAYLGKRFDQINFGFLTEEVAKKVVIDNLYALLRYKYFPKATDEVEEKITLIVKSFTINLKTVLIRVSFDADSECEIVRFIPDGCIAFRNGVFNFRTNDWLFKYNKISIPKISNNIYLYDPSYIITWHVNIKFDPLPINIQETEFEEFMELIRALDVDSKNYCFELMYNMSHDYEDKFILDKFKHLCEILGYLCLQSFSQNFVILIGSGQNGKNSLLDGCFTSRITPSPANIDMKSIEEDKFVTGALENKAQNLFLETEAETLIKSKMIKALTGSMYQTIEHKGEDRYSGIINCKYLWSANDQDKLKFGDTTIGFRRRINIFETWFRWDNKKKFLAKGDYFDTTFSEDLSELKNDIANTIIFIYFAMYGIKLATDDYKHSFKFTHNDWKLQYTDIDFDLKEKVEAITQEKLAKWFSVVKNRELARIMFFDLNRRALYLSDTIKSYGINNFDEYIDKFIKDEDGADLFLQYFVEHDVYIGVRHIQELIGDINAPKQFTQIFKKAFNVQTFINLASNKPYVKVTFRNNKLKVIG